MYLICQKGRDDTLIEIRLASDSVATTDDGSFILVGSDANASPTDDTIIAVGGVYAASDGSSFPIAHMTCYSATGDIKWEKEKHYDELGILFDSMIKIPDGYLAAGANAVEKGSVSVVHCRIRCETRMEVVERWKKREGWFVYY